MKKKLLLIFSISIMLFSIKDVNAIECILRVEISDRTFSCNDIKGKDLKDFKILSSDDKDLSDKFSIDFNADGSRIEIRMPDEYVCATNLEYCKIKVEDGKSNSYAPVEIKNNAYIEPTTQKVEATPEDVLTYSVTLDYNDGETKENKTCQVTKDSTSCPIVLPQIDKEGFSGWGTASTCKKGNIGTIQIDRNDTYYACFETTSMEEAAGPLLSKLILKDKATKKEIQFGNFDKNKFEYTFKILNSVNDIDIETELPDDIEMEVVGNVSLIEGENTFTIKLTDKEGKTNLYTFNVIKLKAGESIAHYLKTLLIGGYEIQFDKNKFEYTLKVDSNVSTLQITAEPELDSEKVEIEGQNDIKDKSVVLIKVTGEDGISTTYKINIEKNNKNVFLIYISLAAIFLLILILVFVIIIKKNKESTKDKTKKVKKSKTKKTTKKTTKNQQNNEDEIEVFKI